MRTYRFSLPLLFVFGFCYASVASADPVLEFDPLTGGNGANNNQSIGWQFDVLSPIQVTGLGWYDEGGDGLVVGHTVGIWDPDGELITSVFVSDGMSEVLDGQFRTVGVDPFMLEVGSGYIVGGENFLINTERLAFDVEQTIDSRINFVDATAGGAGFVRPTAFSAAKNGFYGPAFSVTAVPEPVSSVFCLAITAYWLGRRVR